MFRSFRAEHRLDREIPGTRGCGRADGHAPKVAAGIDLWHRFPFGAFGDDHLDRRDLVPVACDRGRAAGLAMAPAGMVIIGDTPLDVDCARAHGAIAVAVATGLYSAAVLREAGADLVVETLEALAADAEWIERVTAGVG